MTLSDPDDGSTPAASDGGGPDEATRVQAELEAALEAVAEHGRLLDRRRRAEAAVQRAETEVAQATETLAREEADVRRLESFSPTRIWAAMRGSRDADLDREQAERQAAEYAAALAHARMRDADAELRAVSDEIVRLGDVGGRRERALAAREALVRAAGGAEAEALATVAEEIARVHAELREVDEAAAAAAHALAALGAALDQLGSAQGWADYDTFLGGGFFGDMMKYERMDRASALLRTADQALRHLSTELADVDPASAGIGGVGVDGLTRTFDVWFDNIFSDWAVRNRVAEAVQRARAAADRVVGVQRWLEQRRAHLRQIEADQHRRREHLLAP